jgi:archaeosine synthase beta-subunit
VLKPISVSSEQIVFARPAKNRVDERVPYAWFAEQERGPDGTIDDVATILLTNRECPFRCLFCDLWKNTTDARVAGGAIPGQIDFALASLPPTRHIKLYNSGNFFDPQAIPPEDLPEIARRVCGFQTVIVENHPRLCGAACLEFRDLLAQAAAVRSGTSTPQLEIALGLETVHPEILPRLNKQMSADDFRRAAGFLRSHEIEIRAFILLQPPFMPPEESVEWAVRSLEFAFECGARVCTVIPTRGGNGMMELLARNGAFVLPRLAAMEELLERGMNLGSGRVFIDLWDVERLTAGETNAAARIERLNQMNRMQSVLPNDGASA